MKDEAALAMPLGGEELRPTDSSKDPPLIEASDSYETVYETMGDVYDSEKTVKFDLNGVPSNGSTLSSPAVQKSTNTTVPSDDVPSQESREQTSEAIENRRDEASTRDEIQTELTVPIPQFQTTASHDADDSYFEETIGITPANSECASVSNDDKEDVKEVDEIEAVPANMPESLNKAVTSTEHKTSSAETKESPRVPPSKAAKDSPASESNEANEESTTVDVSPSFAESSTKTKRGGKVSTSSLLDKDDSTVKTSSSRRSFKIKRGKSLKIVNKALKSFIKRRQKKKADSETTVLSDEVRAIDVNAVRSPNKGSTASTQDKQNNESVKPSDLDTMLALKYACHEDVAVVSNVAKDTLSLGTELICTDDIFDMKNLLSAMTLGVIKFDGKWKGDQAMAVPAIEVEYASPSQCKIMSTRTSSDADFFTTPQGRKIESIQYFDVNDEESVALDLDDNATTTKKKRFKLRFLHRGGHGRDEDKQLAA